MFDADEELRVRSGRILSPSGGTRAELHKDYEQRSCGRGCRFPSRTHLTALRLDQDVGHVEKHLLGVLGVVVGSFENVLQKNAISIRMKLI